VALLLRPGAADEVGQAVGPVRLENVARLGSWGRRAEPLATVLVVDAWPTTAPCSIAIDSADRWAPDAVTPAVVERLRASETVPSTRTPVAYLDVPAGVSSSEIPACGSSATLSVRSFPMWPIVLWFHRSMSLSPTAKCSDPAWPVM
jgi:hypothetical protein